LQIPGKGDNAILEIFNPSEHTRAAIEPVKLHASENGDTRAIHNFAAENKLAPKTVKQPGKYF
jgi:hypothetical protein